MENIKIKRAILSVSDKTGIVEIAKFLNSQNIEIYSTGGTFKILKENSLPVIEVNELTGFPEMMDGRVKTLHPKVHGGILALRDNPSHVKAAKENNIEYIDLLIVNLYPFEKTVAQKDVKLEDAIENIDIGGPSMLRSSAKNYKFVTIITDPADYQEFMDLYKNENGTTLNFREKCALKVFAKTALYDSAISTFLEKTIAKNQTKTIKMINGKVLRYGENSHQEAVIYQDIKPLNDTLAVAKLLNGKEMSYNNYMDAQAAIDMVSEFDEPAAVVFKHMNPCGVATGKNIREALERAWFGDPISAMGSVLAFNREFDMNTLRFLRGKDTKHYSFQVENNTLIEQEIKRKFIEVIIAPSFSDDALKYLTTKKNSQNVRVLKIDFENTKKQKIEEVKKIDGGYLIQTVDNELVSDLKCVTNKQFSDEMQKLALFSMKCCKITKSNAIVLCRKFDDNSFAMLGMGAGQPNRVDSLRKLAVTKAKENLEYEFRTKKIEGNFDDYYKKVIEKDTVLASDAFFPFDDTVKTAANYNIKYIIQPGGSMKDQDSIDACNELDMSMLFCGNRHFKH